MDEFEILAKLRARGSGGHFGIISVTDFNNEKKRKFLIKEAISSWRKLAYSGAPQSIFALIMAPNSQQRRYADG